MGGVIVFAVLIIVVANRLTARSNQRRADRMMKDMKNGTYNPDKKYFGNQGGWDTDEYTDTTNAPPR
jgi:hypothetical protein